MTGKPVFAASEREKVLFPDPAIPVTRTRRPIPKAPSLIDVSVPHLPCQAHQLRQQQRPCTARQWAQTPARSVGAGRASR